MPDPDRADGRRNRGRVAASFGIDGASVDRTALLVRVADAARTPTIGVQLGLDDTIVAAAAESGHDGGPLAVVRFAPVHAFTVQPAGKDSCELQTAAALALGLRRWTVGLAPPKADRWVLRVTGDILELVGPRNIRFSRGRAEVSASWREAVASHGHAFIIYGPQRAREAEAPGDPHRGFETDALAGLTGGMAAAGLVRCFAT